MIEIDTTTQPTTDAEPQRSSDRWILPELLAPAGDWDCVRAAVENGADAVYFGLERFNARMRAHNFTVADLPELMEYLHRRGVRGYATFNTLVFANELSEAEDYLRSIIAAGVDAAIVQDIGICRLIRQLSPDFPIHASTQMTITSAAGVAFARELGCQLVVLARECSIKEIERIRQAQPDGDSTIGGGAGMPLEVFVHGALCVAYSGQCLTSESLGGRSANRGECAQACRMPYDLVCDGRNVPLGDKRYLLSPQDLAGLEVLSDLVRAGVASLKIEGRLKSPEYVASITRVYRRALDQFAPASESETMTTAARGSVPSNAQGSGSPAPTSIHDDRSRYELEMSFSRGLYPGWFRGINNQQLVHARFGKKRGVYLGDVVRLAGDRVLVSLEAPLKAGDGVVFDSGHPDQKEEGGRVYAIDTVNSSRPSRHGRRREVALTFGRGHLDLSRVHVGDKVWKTSDPALERELRQTYAGDRPRFTRPLHLEVHGRLGTPLTVIARDEAGNIARESSTLPLSDARTQPLTTARLAEQFGRLGGTVFKLGRLQNHLEGTLMLPMSELNRIRRQLVETLEARRSAPRRWTMNDGVSVRGLQPGADAASSPATPAAGNAAEWDLAVLVRNLPQLEAALRCGTTTLYCEFEDPKRYREAVSMVRCADGCAATRRSVFVAPPRIFKTGEDWILKQVRSADADGYLARNHDHLLAFQDSRLVGDFSLNVANPLTAEYLKDRYRLERVTASYDLNMLQLEALLRGAPAEWFEITIHQHMPMFHMEHCVFCAFLSTGTDYTNCGRPCDKHDVKLRDRVGAEHPLKADAGCRNTLFNSAAQTGAEFVERMLALGARHFRIEFLNETPDQVARTISMYRKLLRGEISGVQLWRDLKLVNQLGVTRGQMA